MTTTLNKISTKKVTIPVDARVITSATEALPIVPPSLINKSSSKVTIPLDAIVIAPV